LLNVFINDTSHNRAIVLCGVSLSNAAHASQRSYDGLQGAGNRDYCAVSHIGCLQAESVLAWLAAHKALESSLRAHRGTDRRFRLLVWPTKLSQTYSNVL